MQHSRAEFLLIFSLVACAGFLIVEGVANAQEADELDANRVRNPTTHFDYLAFPVSTNQNSIEATLKQLSTPFGGIVDCGACDWTWAPGDRVEATVNSPSGAAGISAGDRGTVVCGNTSSPPLLISWDGWSQGHDGNGACDCPIYSVPNSSGWFVDCDEVKPAAEEPLCVCNSDYWVGSRVRSTVGSPTGPPGISIGDKGTVVCGYSDPFGIPLLISWDEWTDGHDGNDYCDCPGANLPNELSSAWWVDCSDVEAGSEVSCVCGGVYEKGDRVRALVDSPQGASGISAGDVGTVACGTTSGFPILLISWDDWTLGHDGFASCVCPNMNLPNDSGWFVDCPDVAKEYESIFTSGFEVGDSSAWSTTMP